VAAAAGVDGGGRGQGDEGESGDELHVGGWDTGILSWELRRWTCWGLLSQGKV
jgi:hypothetical protein